MTAPLKPEDLTVPQIDAAIDCATKDLWWPWGSPEILREIAIRRVDDNDARRLYSEVAIANTLNARARICDAINARAVATSPELTDEQLRDEMHLAAVSDDHRLANLCADALEGHRGARARVAEIVNARADKG